MPKRERETPEIAQMVQRMIRALGRRVAKTDEVDLAHMVALRDVLEDAIEDAIVGQLERGRTLSEVAAGLGASRQYVHKRYGRVANRAS